MLAPLYLVDASIYIFQAHFSPHMQVWSRRSEDRSAFVGFVRFIIRLLQVTQSRGRAPIAVAFDESLQSGFRHRLYPLYKSNRVLPDDNLALQLKACAEVCKLLGVHSFGSQEYEADDIIGTLSQTCRHATPGPLAVIIVSRDKDLSQLLDNESDQLWDFYSATRRTRTSIMQEIGIRPEQLPCYLGLTGDAVDCIPGVPGIGAVAARNLLSHFDTLEQMYANLQDVSCLRMRGAKRCATLLSEHQAIALLSRQLATVIRQVPASESFALVSADDLLPHTADHAAISRLLHDMELEEADMRRLQLQLETLTREMSNTH